MWFCGFARRSISVSEFEPAYEFDPCPARWSYPAMSATAGLFVLPSALSNGSTVVDDSALVRAVDGWRLALA